MSSALQAAVRKKLISPPSFVVANLQLEVLMGSMAYGTSSDASDQDIYGFAIPPKAVLFPHLAGVIPGFGDQGQKFDQYQQVHIVDEFANESYDFTIYNIVKYFRLCADCNPNMIDSLFVPENCVKHCTFVGRLVLDNRDLFLSKRAWPRFKGYAYEQLKKLGNKSPTGKRLELVEKYGYDTKFAYHIVRLLNEVQQILSKQTLNLQENNDELKAIRRGEWPEQRVHDHFAERVATLDEVYVKSSLREHPDEVGLKSLLLRCLEYHYGDLSSCVVVDHEHTRAIRQIAEIIDELRLRDDFSVERSPEPCDSRRVPASEAVSCAGTADDLEVCKEFGEDRSA